MLQGRDGCVHYFGSASGVELGARCPEIGIALSGARLWQNVLVNRGMIPGNANFLSNLKGGDPNLSEGGVTIWPHPSTLTLFPGGLSF